MVNEDYDQELQALGFYETLKARWAKAWWEGYAAGVNDAETGEETPNPWVDVDYKPLL